MFEARQQIQSAFQKFPIVQYGPSVAPRLRINVPQKLSDEHFDVFDANRRAPKPLAVDEVDIAQLVGMKKATNNRMKGGDSA